MMCLLFNILRNMIVIQTTTIQFFINGVPSSRIGADIVMNTIILVLQRDNIRLFIIYVKHLIQLKLKNKYILRTYDK